MHHTRLASAAARAASGRGRPRLLLAAVAGLGTLHAAEGAVLAEIDAMPALGAQIVRMAAETDVHDLLVAHLLHEVDGRHEIAVLRDDHGDVVDVERGIADQ